MSLGTNGRIRDWAKWYHYNKDQIGRSEDLKKTQEFYTRAIDGLLEITALLARDVEQLERRTHEDPFQGFYLPSGVKLHDKVKID